MKNGNASKIDKPDISNVQRLDFLLTLIAKLMVDRDLRSKEALEDLETKNDRSETAISPDQI
jgi:hypothetical protein